MNVFERVEETRPEIDGADENISAARVRLLSEIHAETRPARSRAARRPWIITAGLVGAAAAVTAGVLVVGNLTAPSPTVEAIPAPTTDPRQPGEVLPHPAPTGGTGITEPFPGTTPQAGQYLSIVTVDEALLYRGPGGSIYQWFYRPNQYPPINSALMRSTNRLYMPGDRTGEWVNRYGPANERISFYPEDQGPASEIAWDNLLPVQQEPQEWTYTGGIGGEILPLTGSLESYAEYPQDPQALLQYLRDQAAVDPQQVDPEGAAMFEIVGLLASNYAPAATRATFFEALAMSPRAELVSTAGGIATYRFRADGWQGARTTTVSIDTSTGWATEYTVRFDRTDGAEGDMAPTDVPDIHRIFTVSIIDALP